jgi:cytochrome c2
MSRYRKISKIVFSSLLFIALISFSNTSFAADGEAIYKDNCANCHKLMRTTPVLL